MQGTAGVEVEAVRLLMYMAACMEHHAMHACPHTQHLARMFIEMHAQAADRRTQQAWPCTGMNVNMHRQKARQGKHGGLHALCHRTGMNAQA